MQLASYFCYMTHMFLLGALTGGTSYILNVVRSYCLSSRSRFLHSRQMCGVICCLQLVTLYLTWSNWWSLLPIVANIATTIGEYTYNSQKIRLVGLAINSPLKISYDFLVGSVGRNFWRASDASLGNYFYLALWLEKFRPGRRDRLNSKKAL